MQLVQGPSGDRLIGSEIKDRLGGFVVAGDGHTVVGRKAFEQCLDSFQMTPLKEVDGGSSFDEEKDPGGLVHAQEIRDRLLNAVVE